MNPLLRLAPNVRARALWAAFFAIVAALVRLSTPAPPPRTAEGVAAMLGTAAGGEVRPDDFVWEARGGFFHDAFLGRSVLFLARTRSAAAADLYRAQVRLTRAGRPVSLGGVKNLTASPLGDDRDLVARGHHAAYVTVADGAVQGITLLDLDGEGALREARTTGERLGAAALAWLETGSTRGVGRVEVGFAAPPPDARIELSDELLVMALGKEGLPAALDLRDGSLNPGPHNPFTARAQGIPRPARSLAESAAEALRGVADGAPSRAIEAVASALRKKPSPPAARAPFPDREPPPPVEPLDGWPPPVIAPAIRAALPGEGIWAPATLGASVAAGAPPSLYETAIRPVAAHPETLVRLVALDTRQLELRLEGGVDDPRPATGIHGGGRLPAAPLADRVVAAFAAGPAGKAPPGDASIAPRPGFLVDRRPLAPPVPGAATVALERDGRVAFGAWGAGAEVPASITSALQVPDPLLGGGAAGIPLPSATAWGERSALGLLPSGHLIYAWAAWADAATLTAALKLAGCTWAGHLAGAPSPAGFAYLRAAPAAPSGWEAHALAPEMSLPVAALSGGFPTGFFYAVTREVRPAAPLPTGEAADKGWAPDTGTQPSPAWIPAIQTAIASDLGAQVHLTTFAPGRVVFRLRVGGKEPVTKAAAGLLGGALPEAELPRAMAALGLAVGRRRGARGLAVDGTTAYPFRGEAAGVLVIEKGRPRIALSAGFTLPAGADASELPLTADDGKARPEAREVGAMRLRITACVLPDGSLAVASTTFDSDEASTAVLLNLGCSRVVVLDRGTHGGVFLHRAGTESAPSARYDASVLYAVEVPMLGTAGRLE